MFSLIRSSSVHGVEGKRISVEVDISSGLPQVNVVGLPDPAVRESVERVRAAIKNSGFVFPLDRITVNLAPADLRKEGTAFDLAFAAGVLTASGQIDGKPFEDVMLIGELSLNGQLRPVPGVLSMVEEAKLSGIRKVLLPIANVKEAEWIAGMELYALTHLNELRDRRNWEHLRWDTGNDRPATDDEDLLSFIPSCGDYSDVIGQAQAKRALLIAAAGRHNVLFSGPPGTGKTMMIRRLPGILPPLAEEEALEVTKIYSAAGKLSTDAQGLIRIPPFRSPHHTISAGGLVGGGSVPKPGEVTLAHRGVLYLDEFPEFSRQVLEVLRQPLEDGIVTIARSKAVFHFPAELMLAVSYNPCPCGYAGHETNDKRCTCTDKTIARYRSRLSGPLLDRIDIQLEVPRPLEATCNDTHEDKLTSAQMRELVLAARTRAQQRNKEQGIHPNRRLTGIPLRRSILLRRDAAGLLDHALDALGISMRTHDRIVRLSRTIADVCGCEQIEAEHVAEAIQYRGLNY